MGVNLSAGGVSRTVALTALAQLAERWGVPNTKRHQLLGGAQSTVDHWFTELRQGRTDDSRPLDAATMERISHLVSIYDGLHRLIIGAAADAWMNQENRAFADRKPLDVILSGRFEDLLQVRYYVDRALHR